MKKIITLITLIVVFFISCNNNTTTPDNIYVDSEDNGILTNENGDKVYVLYTAPIEINGKITNMHLVKEGDVELLEELWMKSITTFQKEGLTVADAPTSGTDVRGYRKAYFGYELNEIDKKAFSMYDKNAYDKDGRKTIINEFKGVRLVKLPERQSSDAEDYKYNKKFTVAGIYNTKHRNDIPQNVDQDYLIALRPDCIFTKGDINDDKAIFYSMQFMYDKSHKNIDTAYTKFEPYEYKESKKPADWTFATKVNFVDPTVN